MNGVNLDSVLKVAEQRLLEYSSNEFLAKSSALIDSTLQSIYPRFGDVDLHYECQVVLIKKDKQSLEKLLVLSHYVEKNLGFYLRMAIHDQIRNNKDFVDLEFPLKSKNHFKIWICERIVQRGAHWFFGNYMNEKDWNSFLDELKYLYKIKLRRNHKRYNDSTPEKRTIGVGYKDKGTLPKDSRGGIRNFMLTTVQNEIENSRDICETTRYLIEGFLT